jgi:signal transduction histidine kinase
MTDSKQSPSVPGTPELPVIHSDDETGDAHGTEETSHARETTVPPAAAPPDDTLTVMAGEDEGRVFTFGAGAVQLWIGRAPECEIVLRDRGVSRRHACIIRRRHRVMVRDNGAKNGTLVNQRRIVEHELRPGDEITLAPNVGLIFSPHRTLQPGDLPRTESDRVLAEKIHLERLESIAIMVAGVAHELNTPLGVANTANGMVSALADELRRGDCETDKIDELLTDLRASANLVGKNLERASELVRSFKRLSARDPSEELVHSDLGRIVRECVDSLGADAERRQVKIRMVWLDGTPFPWIGFAESLGSVLVQLIQNSLSYAYDGSAPGYIDIRIFDDGPRYRIELEDYGAGVVPSILGRIFEPFTTSRRDSGAMGMGLAIARNAMINLLRGSIKCTSKLGKGTKFVLTVPHVVPVTAE